MPRTCVHLEPLENAEQTTSAIKEKYFRDQRV